MEQRSEEVAEKASRADASIYTTESALEFSTQL